MKLFDVITVDLNEEPKLLDTGDPVSDWLDFSVQNLTRKSNQEAIKAAQSVLSLTEGQGNGREEARGVAGLVIALARLSITYTEIAPLLDAAILNDPHGMGAIARKVKRLGEELD